MNIVKENITKAALENGTSLTAADPQSLILSF